MKTLAVLVVIAGLALAWWILRRAKKRREGTPFPHGGPHEPPGRPPKHEPDRDDLGGF